MLKASVAISAGATVYWDETNSVATTVAAGNKYIGKALKSAESADATVRVLLNAAHVADTPAE
jgi:predicted RecA/RadA family phage recombinase